jgi:hypothetical protein
MIYFKYLFASLSLASIGILLHSATRPGKEPETTVEERDMQRLLNFFEKSQSSCDDKSGVYSYKHHPYAHYSVVHVIANSFLEAVVSNYLFVHPGDDRSEYISKARCESQNLFQCMYKPLGPAPVCPEHVPVVERNTAFLFDQQTEAFVGDGVISELKFKAGLEGNHGTLFYISAAVHYVTRLRPEVDKHVERMTRVTLGNTPLEKTIGIQMRLGENGMARFRGTPELFARTVAQINTSYGPFEKVWVTTDGKPEEVDEFKRLVKKWGGPPVVQSPSKFWQLTLPGWVTPAERMSALNNQQFGQWDEAMSIQAEMKSIAHCGYVVSSMDSNVGRYLFEEMYVHHGLTSSLPYFDATQTMWFSGWRSSPFPHGHLLRGFKGNAMNTNRNVKN